MTLEKVRSSVLDSSSCVDDIEGTERRAGCILEDPSGPIEVVVSGCEPDLI